jgi:hypothetical protein
MTELFRLAVHIGIDYDFGLKVVSLKGHWDRGGVTFSSDVLSLTGQYHHVPIVPLGT